MFALLKQSICSCAVPFPIFGCGIRDRTKMKIMKMHVNEDNEDENEDNEDDRTNNKDACDRTKWRGIVKTMTIRNPANSVDGENTGSNM